MDFTIARKNGSGAIAWTEEQVRYIITEYVDKDRTLKELSQEFNVQPQSIRNLLRKNKIDITNKKTRNFPRNSYYFQKIDCQEKAYWLGVLLSDGSVYKNKVSLGLKDLEHVEKFRRAIQATNNKIVKVVDNRFFKECINWYFTINDSQLVEDLSKYGMVQNKTYVGFRFPNIPEEFKYDFVRGYFDGDGSISFSQNQNKYRLDWCGNFEFLTDLKIFLGKENISLCQNSVSKITYNLKIAGKKDVLRILDAMYKNSTEETRLNRKFEIVQKAFLLGDYAFEPAKAGCE